MKKAAAFCLLFICAPAAAASAHLELNLKQAEAQALDDSPRLQAARRELEAAGKKARGQWAQFWPRLSVEGSWRYVTEVPNLPTALSGGKAVKFGDNENYSIGPQATWTAWSSGALRGQWRSAQALERNKEEGLKAARKQVLLSTRLAYFQARMALEQVRLLADSLKLAEAQYDDIENRRRGGISNRIDSLSAHQEVLIRQRQFRQAQTALALALRELFSLTGRGQDADVSLPMDHRSEDAIPKSAPAPSILLLAEPVNQIQKDLELAVASQPDPAHPQLRMIEESIQALGWSARGAGAGHGPKIQLTARASHDRPNGPIIETIHQSMVGAAVSLPLFEGGRVADQVAELREQAAAAEETKRDAEKNLLLQWQKAQDQLLGLKAQQEINRQAVQETEELARLVYTSYKTGAVNYIDVQTANVRALEAKVQAAMTEVQILSQLAVLSGLSAGD